MVDILEATAVTAVIVLGLGYICARFSPVVGLGGLVLALWAVALWVG